MDAKDFIKEVNSLRLNNKNSWYQFTGEVEGKQVSLEGYNTWLQIFKVNGLDYSNGMDAKVGEFKTALEKPFN